MHSKVQGYTDVFEFSAAIFAGKLAVPKCWLHVFVAFNPLSAQNDQFMIPVMHEHYCTLY